MNDDAGSLLQHSGEEAAIQTHSREEIQFKFLLPNIISKLKDPTAWRRRSANTVNQNIKPAKTMNSFFNDLIRSRACAEVRFNESFGIGTGWDGPGCREYFAPTKQQSIYGGLSDP